MRKTNGAFDLSVATSYLLQVDTALAPHNDSSVTDLPTFKLEALVAITDLSEQEDRISAFELKQEIVGRYCSTCR